MARFKKGQTVFVAFANFAHITGDDYTQQGDRRFSIVAGAVVRRTVDSCGAKFMTFVDTDGHDQVFNRRERADDLNVCATEDEAFTRLRAAGRGADVIIDRVLPDTADAFKGDYGFIAK